MNPSPFAHPTQSLIRRVTIVLSGEAGSGKSALAANLIASLRAQGFQAGLSDQLNDQPVDRIRFAQNTIVSIEVAEPAKVAVDAAKTPRELDLEARLKDLDNKLNFTNTALAAANAEKDRLTAELEVKVAAEEKAAEVTANPAAAQADLPAPPTTITP